METPTHLLSKEHFIAQKQLESDYENLVIHFEDYNNCKGETDEMEKAKKNCLKYLNSIIDNKKILGYNYSFDYKLRNQIEVGFVTD